MKKEIIENLKSILSIVKKPVTALKDVLTGKKDLKSIWIIVAISTLSFMLLSLISKILSHVFYREYSFLGNTSGDLKFDIERIKNINIFETIFQGLLQPIIIIALVALIMHVVMVLFTKKGNFFKHVYVSAFVFLVITISTFILVPIFGLISPTIAAIPLILAIVYSLLIIMYSSDAQIEIEDSNKKFLFNFVNISVILISVTIYYILVVIPAMFNNIDLGGLL